MADNGSDGGRTEGDVQGEIKGVYCPTCKGDGFHEEGCKWMFLMPCAVEFSAVPEYGDVIRAAMVLNVKVRNEIEPPMPYRFKCSALASFHHPRELVESDCPGVPGEKVLVWKYDDDEEELNTVTEYFLSPGIVNFDNVTERRRAIARTSYPTAPTGFSTSTPAPGRTRGSFGNVTDGATGTVGQETNPQIAELTSVTLQIGKLLQATIEQQNRSGTASLGQSSFSVERYEMEQKGKRKGLAERDVPCFTVNEQDRTSPESRATKFRNFRSKMLQLTEHTNDEKLVVLKRKLGSDENLVVEQCEDAVKADFEKLLAELTRRYDPANDPLQAARMFEGVKQRPDESLDMFNIRYSRAMHPLKHTMSTSEIWVVQKYIFALKNMSTRRACNDLVSKLSSKGKAACMKDVIVCAENHEKSSLAARGMDMDGKQLFEVSMMDVGGQVLEPEEVDEYDVNVAGGQRGGVNRYKPNNNRPGPRPRADGRPVSYARFNGPWDDKKNCIIHRSVHHALVDCTGKDKCDCIRCGEKVPAGGLSKHLHHDCKAIRCYNCKKWGDHMARDCPDPRQDRFPSGKKGEKRPADEDSAASGKKSVA